MRSLRTVFGLNPATFTGSVVSECTDLYFTALGLDKSNLRGLRLLAWLLHSHSEYLHFVAKYCSVPKQEILAQSLFVQLWQWEFET